eukprot:173771-Chlamydomonas_euryale.AAC.1
MVQTMCLICAPTSGEWCWKGGQGFETATLALAGEIPHHQPPPLTLPAHRPTPTLFPPGRLPHPFIRTYQTLSATHRQRHLALAPYAGNTFLLQDALASTPACRRVHLHEGTIPATLA